MVRAKAGTTTTAMGEGKQGHNTMNEFHATMCEYLLQIVIRDVPSEECNEWESPVDTVDKSNMWQTTVPDPDKS